MSSHLANVSWQRQGASFVDKRYSRAHVWKFDGGAEVRASASPHVVPPPGSDPQAVDPEEAFVAALASCHMLWFLSIACQRRFVVERYDDAAEGVMEKNAQGKLAITRVRLRPRVTFAGPQIPSDETILSMHHEAHAECFLANSVRSEIHCEPVLT